MSEASAASNDDHNYADYSYYAEYCYYTDYSYHIHNYADYYSYHICQIYLYRVLMFMFMLK